MAKEKKIDEVTPEEIPTEQVPLDLSKLGNHPFDTDIRLIANVGVIAEVHVSKTLSYASGILSSIEEAEVWLTEECKRLLDKG